MSRSAVFGVSLAALSADAAAAAEGPEFELSGFFDAALFDASQDTGGFADPDQEGFDALANGKLNLRGSLILDDGTELGARVEVRLQSGAVF